MGLSVCSQAPLDVIADVMNCRSRKTLDWYTPHEVYSGKLAKFEDPTQILQYTTPVLHLNLSARINMHALAAM
jgi:hypothetical protein